MQAHAANARHRRAQRSDRDAALFGEVGATPAGILALALPTAPAANVILPLRLTVMALSVPVTVGLEIDGEGIVRLPGSVVELLSRPLPL